MYIETLRKITGLTQKEFANKYEIPIRTLQKWEQHQSFPANYLIKLLEKDICSQNDEIIKFKSEKDEFIYNITRGQLINKKGIIINIEIKDVKKIKKHNLGVYSEILFENYNKNIKSFIEDCEYDKKSDTLWERFY